MAHANPPKKGELGPRGKREKASRSDTSSISLMKTPLRIGCGNIYLNDSLFSFPSVRFYTTVYSAVAHPKGIEKGSFSPQLCILDIISQCIYIDGDSSSSEDPDEKGR